MEKQKLGLISTLFFFLYLILPSYFALEISSSFPLLTASRIVLLLLVIVYTLNKKGKIGLKAVYKNDLKNYLTIYFVSLIIANLAYITKTTEAIKQLFSIVLEQLIVLWIIVKILDSRGKINRALELMVYTSGVVAVVSIIGTVIGQNPFEYLNTVQRTMLISNYTRLGFLRATAGFGHAVYYGAYNAVMIPITMYFIENARRKTSYAMCLGLQIIALFLANSRGSIISVLFVGLIMLITKRKKQLRKYRIYFVVGAVLIIFLFAGSSQIREYAQGVYKSLVNIFFSDGSVIDNYGKNTQGVLSRLTQLSSIQFTLKQNPLFGLGAGAQNRGVVSVLRSNGTWGITNTFDSALVSIACQYGIVGLIGYSALYIGIGRTVFNKTFLGEIEDSFKYSYLIYLLCLLSISGIDSLLWVMISILVAYCNLNEK